jgi:nucleotide-binding universal stress UspA family protein
LSETKAPSDYRRILVALDASRESQAALEAAAKLAARLEAQLLGLFVEDADLLNLAALPFSREVPLLSRTSRILQPEQIERDLKSRAAMARRALAETATALHIGWSFRIARGRVETELLAAAKDADLVALGKGTRPLSGHAFLGSTGRAIVARTIRSVLFATMTSGPADAAVAAVYSEGHRSGEALALAARLAKHEGRPLVVFVLGDTPSALSRLESGILEQLQSIGMSGSVRRVNGTGLADLLQAVEETSISLLVVGASAVLSDTDLALDTLVEQCTCSILLVRGWPQAEGANPSVQ